SAGGKAPAIAGQGRSGPGSRGLIGASSSTGFDAGGCAAGRSAVGGIAGRSALGGCSANKCRGSAGSPTGGGGSKLSGTFFRCRFIDRYRKYTAITSTRITRNPIGLPLPVSESASTVMPETFTG